MDFFAKAIDYILSSASSAEDGPVEAKEPNPGGPGNSGCVVA